MKAYTFHGEDETSYHIGHPAGHVFQVPKRSAHPELVRAIKLLPKAEVPRMAEGGISVPTVDGVPIDVTLPPDPQAADAVRAGLADPNAPPPIPAPSGPGVDLQSIARDALRSNPLTATTALALGAGGRGNEAPAPAAPAGATEGPPQPPAQPPLGGPGPTMPPFPAMPGYPSGPVERGVQQMVETGREGAQMKAQAEAEQAKAMTDAYTQYNAQLAETEKQRQAGLAAVNGEINATIADIKNQHIDPSHLWSSKSTGQKAAALIGIALGGIGAAFTGRNDALQVVNTLVERDIDAQKANLGKSENLLSQLYRKYGNIEEATQAARAYLTASVAGQAGLAAARTGNVTAQANAKLMESQLQGQALGPMAQIVNGKYQAEVARYQMAWQQRMWQMTMGQMGGGGQGEQGYIPSSANRPMISEPSLKGVSEQRKDANERRVDLPDVGPYAHTYAKTPEQAKALRDTFSAYHDMETSLAALERIAKENPGKINVWGTKAREEFNVQHGALNLAMNRLMQQQRFTDTENKIYGQMLADPMKFLFTGAGKANLTAVRSLIQQKRLADYTGQLGIDPRLLGGQGGQGGSPAVHFTPVGG